jgi:transglutaminase-like putative cysteine protease
MTSRLNGYLSPTPIIDADHPRVQTYAASVLEKVPDRAVDKAVALFYAVRDGIWYDPYLPFFRPEHYRASDTLARGRAFCIGKAALLCALGRFCRIPSRLGFADVRNHLATPQLIEFLGSDVFVFHAYTEFHLKNQWVKATPAFNLELCRLHDVIPLEFNGYDDAIFHPFNSKQQLFMEYIRDHGSFSDVPVEQIVTAMQTAYGHDRIKQWMDAYESGRQEAPHAK